MQEDDLGTVSMGTVYTSFTLFSVASSPVVTRIGPKRALVVGTSGYVLFILANLVPSWCVRLGRVSRSYLADTDPVLLFGGGGVGSELDAWYLFDKNTLDKMQTPDSVYLGYRRPCYLINSCLIACSVL